MFLHINTFGQQLSVHSKDTVPAVEAVPEKKDEAGNIVQAAIASTPVKPAEPLVNAVKETMTYWKRIETDLVGFVDEVVDKVNVRRRLDLTKSAGDNSLTENSLITITSQEMLDEVVKEKEAALNEARKLAGKLYDIPAPPR